MMNNNIKIELDIEDYIDLLDQRRNFVEEHYNWHIPDCLWDYFCELVALHQSMGQKQYSRL